MNLTPDFSLVIQVILFVVVWQGLNRLAFQPTQEVLDQRHKRTVTAERDAKSMVASAQDDQDVYDKTVQEKRTALAADTAAARSAAQEESSRALNAARDSANQSLAAQRAAVAEQIEAARASLSGSADDIARRMIERATGNT